MLQQTLTDAEYVGLGGRRKLPDAKKELHFVWFKISELKKFIQQKLKKLLIILESIFFILQYVQNQSVLLLRR